MKTNVYTMERKIKELTNKKTFWDDVREIVGFYDDTVFIEDWDIKRLQRVADSFMGGVSMNNEVGKIKELIKQLNKASDAYYNSSPIMSDYDWDKLLDELKYLEDETGIIYPNSPTQNVGYSVLDEITKVKHNHSL